MPKIKMYENSEIAEICGCNLATVRQYALKPENEINFVGTGKRKIYIWFDEDIERFKNRNTAMGRPKKPV